MGYSEGKLTLRVIQTKKVFLLIYEQIQGKTKWETNWRKANIRLHTKTNPFDKDKAITKPSIPQFLWLLICICHLCKKLIVSGSQSSPVEVWHIRLEHWSETSCKETSLRNSKNGVCVHAFLCAEILMPELGIRIIETYKHKPKKQLTHSDYLHHHTRLFS